MAITIIPEEFISNLKKNCRIIGIDLGEKTVGLALSDVECTIASSLLTIKRKKFREDWVVFYEILQKFDVGGIVMGLPLNMNGTKGPRAQSSQTYAENINREKNIPILLWDERMSTIAVERILIEAELSRKKRSTVIDAAAATFILQGSLDRMNNIKASHQPNDNSP